MDGMSEDRVRRLAAEVKQAVQRASEEADEMSLRMGEVADHVDDQLATCPKPAPRGIERLMTGFLGFVLCMSPVLCMVAVMIAWTLWGDLQTTRVELKAYKQELDRVRREDLGWRRVHVSHGLYTLMPPEHRTEPRD